MTANEPLVSIITATYNWSSVLRYAIRSARNQTLTNFEMLVMGDGCTDDSGEVVASFNDPRIQWHNAPANSGNQSAPNMAGLALARGRYVAYLGHDDIWHPSHLQTLVDGLEASGADFAFTLTEAVGPPGTGIRALWCVSASGQYEPSTKVSASALMHRRAMAAEVGGWRDYRLTQDAPDRNFYERARLAGKRSLLIPALTVIKFPSAWRKNSYRERRSDEQAEYTQRMEAEPDFLQREMTAIATAYALGKGDADHLLNLPQKPKDAPPGWTVEQWRRIRGLEANTLAAVPVRRRSPTRAMTDPLRKGLLRMLQWLGN